jgi:hypothetical protein
MRFFYSLIGNHGAQRQFQNRLCGMVTKSPVMASRRSLVDNEAKMDMQARSKKESRNATPEDETTTLLISVTLALAVLLVVVAIDRVQPLRTLSKDSDRPAQSPLIYSAATSRH